MYGVPQDTVNGSDRSPILRVYNLVPGDYTFKLTVADEKGKTTSDTATIHLIRGKQRVDFINLPFFYETCMYLYRVET